MADLIDRDALGVSLFHLGKKDAADIYRLIMDVPAVNRWISVEDALPDHYDEILFCERDRTIHKGYMYWDGTFIENHVKFRKSDIVAWMPMPDAYEQPEKE